MAYEVQDGSRLSAEIDGLVHSTNYGVTVFGVDERGQLYKTIEVNATTRNSKNVYTILTLNKLFSYIPSIFWVPYLLLKIEKTI